MADLVKERDAVQDQTTAADGAAEDWEVDEVLARFDRAAEGRDTRAGGTTSCH